jgi:hypothetical protein
MAPSEHAKRARREAEGGSAEAQFMLGVWHDLGNEGLEQDEVQAAAFYRQAAELGLAAAQFALAGCYCSGLGVEQNFALAAEWGRKAADQGQVAAQYLVGELYALGEKGVKRTCLWGRGTWSSAPLRASRTPSCS